MPPLAPLPPPAAAVWRPYLAGRKAHGRVGLDFEAFAAHLGDGPVPLAAEDYYLAVACNAGVDGAWERLASRYRRPLRSFLRRRGATAAEVDALLDEFWGVLATPPARGHAATRLGTYDGRGALFSWLATVAWRRLTDTWRARRGSALAPDDVVGSDAADPARCAAAEETDRQLGDALEEAWGGLTLRELEAVVLKYRHHLPQTDIARVLGVGSPRVTRLLQSATQRLRTALEARFELRPLDPSGTHALRAVVERMLERAELIVAEAGDRGEQRDA